MNTHNPVQRKGRHPFSGDWWRLMANAIAVVAGHTHTQAQTYPAEDTANDTFAAVLRRYSCVGRVREGQIEAGQRSNTTGKKDGATKCDTATPLAAVLRPRPRPGFGGARFCTKTGIWRSGAQRKPRAVGQVVARDTWDCVARTIYNAGSTAAAAFPLAVVARLFFFSFSNFFSQRPCLRGRCSCKLRHHSSGFRVKQKKCSTFCMNIISGAGLPFFVVQISRAERNGHEIRKRVMRSRILI